MILKTPLRRQVGCGVDSVFEATRREHATAWHTKEQGGDPQAGPAFCNGGYVGRGLGKHRPSIDTIARCYKSLHRPHFAAM